MKTNLAAAAAENCEKTITKKLLKTVNVGKLNDASSVRALSLKVNS